MSKLEQIGPATYVLPKTNGMQVPGLVIATDELLKDMEIDKPLEQVKNVAHLPGIVGYSIAMPDIHWGYGFPIGGVAAMDAETGFISPGGVGYDINCGVRLAIVPESYQSLKEKQQDELLKKIFKLVPSGVGHGHKARKALTATDYRDLTTQGARWSVNKGYGFSIDLDHIESNGIIDGADIQFVSSNAQDRGKNQLGSIGSGNHFIEIGEVEKVFLPEIAKKWGVQQGQTYILIHSGSRGFGHQICQDTLDAFMHLNFAKDLPDKQLVAAPIHSPEGKKYYAAMAAAANFAFNNRQQILHYVRQAFSEVLKIESEHIRLIYDVCHNIAKFETHMIDGKLRKLCVHRKGATRAFGPGVKELSPLFQETGQPVLVPGDMGRASYIMVGCGNPLDGTSLTWCSCCHGAGRARSRVQSMKAWKSLDPIRYMKEQGVQVMASSYRTIAEEMPDAYKNVDMVVSACQEAGLANMVGRLRPHLVVKG